MKSSRTLTEPAWHVLGTGVPHKEPCFRCMPGTNCKTRARQEGRPPIFDVRIYRMPSGAVLEGRAPPFQPKSAGMPGITRQRVGLPLKIFD